MGEVYHALDTRLGRSVALKLLSTELTVNKDRLRRFKQEARTASALNHPNILTIYDIGQEGTNYYIASELVDGTTLRHQIKRARMALAEIFNVSVQIGSALEAAHAKGIVHRDIKPENIMLRADGYVKVLDFGLAKLTENSRLLSVEPDAPTITDFYSDAGSIVGTILYMSPEQLRVQGVDGRTDLWSLGIVIYEMLTQQLPFKHSTKSDAIVSILEREPIPLSYYVPDVPIEVEQIVMKALRKDREKRYQSARDLLDDLEKFGRSHDLVSGQRRVMLPAANNYLAITSPDNIRSTSENKHAFDEERDETRRIFENNLTISQLKHPRWGSRALLTSLMLILGFVFVLYIAIKLSVNKPTQTVEFTKLVMPGRIIDASISPDGKYIATVMDTDGKQSLWVRQVNASSNLQIVAPDEDKYKGLTFSPDGDYVYYLKRKGDTGVLSRVPVLGGTPRKLITDIDTPVTFSPDGSHLAFVRYYRDKHSTAMIVAQEDGTEEKSLAALSRPDFFTTGGFYSSGPAWSPDGKIIACPTLNINDQSHMNVAAVRIEDGKIERLNVQPWFIIDSIEWLSDSTGLLMNAMEKSSSPFQIWLLSYPAGQPRLITNDPNSYTGLSVTQDSNVLLTLKSEMLSSIWIISGRKNGSTTHIASSQYQGATGISWTPDGKLVYAATNVNDNNIWIMDADGRNHKQLTVDEHTNIEPAVSPDGRYIAFASYQNGTPHIWRIDIDGGNLKQLTSGTYEDTPSWSPDSRWVIYHSFDPGRDSVWKIPVDGGEPVLITRMPSTQPVVSPDGKTIACFSRDDPADSPWKIVVLPFDGGEILKTFDIPPSVNTGWPGIRWSPDGSALTYVANIDGHDNFWNQPLSGGAPIQLTDFQEDRIFSYAWSLDGNQLACVRGVNVTSPVLVRSFKQ